MSKFKMTLAVGLGLIASGCMAKKNPNDQKPFNAAPGFTWGIQTGNGPTQGTRPESGFDTSGMALPGSNPVGPTSGGYADVTPDSLASQDGAVATNARPDDLLGTVNQGTSNLEAKLSTKKAVKWKRGHPNHLGQGGEPL